MSEPIAETFVSIVPIVDEAQFKAQTQAAVTSAVESVKVPPLPDIKAPVVDLKIAAPEAPDLAAFKQETQNAATEAIEQIKLPPIEAPKIVIPPVEAPDLTNFTREIESAVGNLKANVPVDTSALTKAREDALVSAQAAETQAAQLAKQQLIGAASMEQATAAAVKYADAVLVAARADVALSVATGKDTATLQTSIQVLRQHEQALLADAEAKRINAAGGGGGGPGGPRGPRSGTFRDQLRNVAEGEAGLGSLLGPAALARFTVAGLAIGTVFTSLQHLREGLKVTGDEAFTTEGKFRNFGSELLGGDLIAGIQALRAEAPSAADELKKLGQSADTTSLDYRKLAAEQQPTLDKLELVRREVEKQPEAYGEMGQAVVEAANQLGDAVSDARALADALDTSARAAADVESAIASAGNAVAVFGEQARGTGEIARENARPGAGAQFTDETDSDATSSSVADSIARRTESLNDDLENAKAEAARLATAEKNQKDVVEGAAARHKATVDANTKVILIERQIAAQEKAARDEAAREAERRKKEAEAARKKAAQDADDLLHQRLAEREGQLKAAVQIAELDERSVVDDKKALAKLANFYHEKSQNLKLELTERQTAAAQERATRDEINAINKTQLADALQVREQNLENAILAAKLTDDADKDDDKANAAKLRFLKNQVKRAKGDALAVAQAKGELLQFQLSLKDSASAGGGQSLEDLFKSAQDQFDQFGSNVSSSVTTGSDVRGALAGGILAQNPKITPGQQAQLTEAQKTNQLLQGILGAVTRSGAAGANATRAVSPLNRDLPGDWTARAAMKLAGTTG